MSNFCVYITTNPRNTVLYTGMTNDLECRLIEHYLERGNRAKFAGRYHCYNLLYYEPHDTALGAIDREKVIKGWVKRKKIALIKTYNPELKFLNSEITTWPPEEGVTTRY